MESAFALVSFGHPLLDIISPVDSAFLQRYKVAPGSVELATDEQASIYDDALAIPGTETVPGGAAMNTVRVVRWLLAHSRSAMPSPTRARDGVIGTGNEFSTVAAPSTRCCFVGALGEDSYGEQLLDALRRDGVDVLYTTTRAKPTGTCACLIVQRERSLVARIGAAVELPLDFVRGPSVGAALRGAGCVYMEGFFLNLVSSPDSCLTVARACRAQGTPFAFNLSAPYVCAVFKDRLRSLVPYADLVFGNREEFEAYASVQPWAPELGGPGEGRDTLAEIVTRVARDTRQPPTLTGVATVDDAPVRPRLVVATDGGHATLWASAEEPELVHRLRPPPMEPSQIVDTNAAGDAFVGGFLARYIRNRERGIEGGVHIERCITQGHATARVILRHNGCTFPPVPDEKAQLRD
jgi:adenosine kinase